VLEVEVHDGSPVSGRALPTQWWESSTRSENVKTLAPRQAADRPVRFSAMWHHTAVRLGAMAASAPQLNQSVRKAMTLLRATAAHGDGASVSALARAAGLPRATALRLIQTMEAEGVLVRGASADRVLLGPELIRLAREADPGALLLELARPRLGELSEALRETVTLSVVRADGELDLVHQVDGPQHLVPRSWLGRRFPLHASSSGKLLLASFDAARLERHLVAPLAQVAPSTITSARALRRELAKVRAQGFASTLDELEEGLAGVSVGVVGETHALLGTINVSGLARRFDEAGRARAVEHARAVAAEIEAALGRNGR
jgi:DNA-binding IclR family transcriptional regulator